jgi:hypothetical protein
MLNSPRLHSAAGSRPLTLMFARHPPRVTVQADSADSSWGLGASAPPYPDAALDFAAALQRMHAHRLAPAASPAPAPAPGGAAAAAAAAIIALQRRRWWADARVPAAWLRRAAARAGGEQDFLFCPHSRDLALPEGEGGSDLARQLLQERWLSGEPVIVRGCEVSAAGCLCGQNGAGVARHSVTPGRPDLKAGWRGGHSSWPPALRPARPRISQPLLHTPEP